MPLVRRVPTAWFKPPRVTPAVAAVGRAGRGSQRAEKLTHPSVPERVADPQLLGTVVVATLVVGAVALYLTLEDPSSQSRSSALFLNQRVENIISAARNGSTPRA